MVAFTSLTALTLIFLVLHWLIEAYMAILFIRLILDWVAVLSRWQPRGVVYTLVNAVYVVTDPPLNFLRRYIRPIPFGPVSFDVSFLVLWFVLGFLRIIL
ncbi:hemolysin [Alloscardovia macacae]|uniref:Hemolysin n=1 Tax=Alloscardovia macacae TaxID=1160091 RepID=A0A1Y2SYR6_9BIFI|nr:YggT family protein [Alloscardovia macacae]OTA25928.1 hemolysin [Alloscardovia macacae]OTA28044.1 hemolysin [Alloscardovia macacae]